MKKIIFLISVMLFAFTFTVDAQKQNKPFADDTIKADTNIYVSNYRVDKFSTTTVIFSFTHVDVADSLNVAKIQGSMDNDEFYDISDATATSFDKTTDGTTRLYVTNPVDLFFRTFLSCATGDTVAITNPTWIVKED